MSAISNEVKMVKDMFEQFRDRELPPEIKAHVESSADIHGKNNKKKWWFTAGFFVAENIQKIRKAQGLED